MLPKLRSYLLGNLSSRPGQVLNGNLSAEAGDQVPRADVGVVGVDHPEHFALMLLKWQTARGAGTT